MHHLAQPLPHARDLALLASHCVVTVRAHVQQDADTLDSNPLAGAHLASADCIVEQVGDTQRSLWFSAAAQELQVGTASCLPAWLLIPRLHRLALAPALIVLDPNSAWVTAAQRGLQRNVAVRALQKQPACTRHR